MGVFAFVSGCECSLGSWVSWDFFCWYVGVRRCWFFEGDGYFDGGWCDLVQCVVKISACSGASWWRVGFD